MVSRPKASGNLGTAHRRKDRLSKHARYSIFIHMIFRPFVIRSGFHFSLIALFKMKCRKNEFALCAIAKIYWPRGGVHTYKLGGPLQVLPKTSDASYRIARSLCHIPPPNTSHKILAHRRSKALVPSPFPNTANFEWSENRKINTVPNPHSRENRALEASYSTDAPPLCSVYRFHRTVCYIRAYRFS